MGITACVAAERRELADVLDGLTPAQWNAPSLCHGWAVRHVVAHITMPFRYSPPRFVLELAKAGGRFNHMADRVARRDGSQPTDALARALRDNAEHPWTPPGGGKEGALTHDVVHGLDITRPLGIGREARPERLRIVLDSLVRPKSLRFFGTGDIGPLRASDLDWSHGTGEPVAASAADLVLLLTGRPVDADAGADAGRDGGLRMDGTGDR
jgi:uncharacterized protein (TIGR03083 family)